MSNWWLDIPAGVTDTTACQLPRPFLKITRDCQHMYECSSKVTYHSGCLETNIQENLLIQAFFSVKERPDDRLVKLFEWFM